jgi:hypothetical protein
MWGWGCLGRKLFAFVTLLDCTASSSQEHGAQIAAALGKLIRGGGDEVHFNDELVSDAHVLPDRQYSEASTSIATVSTLIDSRAMNV